MGRSGGFDEEASDTSNQQGFSDEASSLEELDTHQEDHLAPNAPVPPSQSIPTLQSEVSEIKDGNWQVTEQLLQTLNQELGELKEYVLTELRGEITALRSEKVQLQSQVQELRHQQDELLSDRQQAQQQQWAQQFAQVLTQNLRQQLQAQVFGLSESGGTVPPEQRLSLLHQQMVSLEEGLGTALRTIQQELGQHQSELSQQLLRMQDLEQQGEMLLGTLVQKLQGQQHQTSQSRLTEGTMSSVPLPAPDRSTDPVISAPMAQTENSTAVGLPGLDWAEPDLREPQAFTGEGTRDNHPPGESRQPGHPTDVASVMAAMSNLTPPLPTEADQSKPDLPLDPHESITSDAASPGSIAESGELAEANTKQTPPPAASTSRAAAMATPPRLTTPLSASSPPVEVNQNDGPDEAFIADFPMDVVRPDLSGFPAADSPGTASPGETRPGDNHQPPPSSQSGPSKPPPAPAPTSPQNTSNITPGKTTSGIAMPPGMVDRVKGAVEPPQPPPASISPWMGDPPTTISSLMELTDESLGEELSRAREMETDPTPSLSFVGAEEGNLTEGVTFPPIATPKEPLADSIGGETGGASQVNRPFLSPLLTPLQRSGAAAIAVVTLLLGVVQYSTVQVLFHGAPWIADGTGFIAATWSSALVTFWVRMLMVLPFMIVIGQGLYPPLLPEMQAVFRDRDPIPLISISASGLFFFLAHFFLYGSIAHSSATPAVALFFLYAALGQFLGWGLFNQRLSPARLLATVPMGLGVLVLLWQWNTAGGQLAGLISGLFYALFLMLTAVNGRRMNPLTLTVLQFGLAWLWAVPAVFFLPQTTPTNDLGYVIACAVLSGTVGLSQFFSLACRRRLGAGLSAMFQGTLPLLLGLVCLFLTNEILPISQVFGVVLIAGGAIALGLQRASRDAAR